MHKYIGVTDLHLLLSQKASKMENDHHTVSSCCSKYIELSVRALQFLTYHQTQLIVPSSFIINFLILLVLLKYSIP